MAQGGDATQVYGTSGSIREQVSKVSNLTMASQDSNSEPAFEKLSNEFLICPLCYEQYKTPKVLPCQHTFCLPCLRSYVAARGIDGTVPCPMCKELVLIPNNDVANLKNNFMIVSLLHFVESSKAASPPAQKLASLPQQGNTSSLDKAQIPCGACSEAAGLNSFCQICSLWLCSTCTKAHSRLAQTSNHQLMSASDVDKHCKSLVDMGEKALSELQLANLESQEILISQIQQLPENLSLMKAKILSVAEEAHKIIQDKTTELTQHLTQFQQNQEQELSMKLDLTENRKKDLDQIQTLLSQVNISSDGYDNQVAMKTVENFLNTASVADFSLCSDVPPSLAFTPFNTLPELKNLNLGHLSAILDPKNSTTFLNNRPLTVHKISSLIEREYISALAISKFADKYVVSNNKSIVVFKNGSKQPTTFLSPLTERPVCKPWGITYCEEHRLVFITDAGRHEGEGAVVAYSHDGAFQSVIASGLTLPRGITVHKNFIFVCDQIDKCIYIFNIRGKIHKILKKTADGRYYFTGPMFIAVGNNGLIAVSDDCYSVKIFDRECNLLFTYYSSLAESQFWDVTVMHCGSVIVCDWKHGLHKISPDFRNNGLVCIEKNSLREPSALAVLENGNAIFVATFEGEVYTVI
ncbi:tripartite motif-containing protein 2 [Biomphalaria pfeifferi]|uniref:Tripartite motif-containing protein 2 n=1 Tax=Biomphalaria pfeifferi TaxID=112525 RepID=A0AAD8BII2_BIOPF|nr:tripartite motif-containing protein 2 [Biomphalaria pfeifferi]